MVVLLLSGHDRLSCQQKSLFALAVNSHPFLPPANEVWDKVMFSQSSAILSRGGSTSRSGVGQTPPMDTTGYSRWAGSKHPTGMHSCLTVKIGWIGTVYIYISLDDQPPPEVYSQLPKKQKSAFFLGLVRTRRRRQKCHDGVIMKWVQHPIHDIVI